MTEPVQTTGKLDMPVFKGPPQPHKWRAPPRRSPWEKHFELGRQHPGRRDNDNGWMMVSRITRGGRKTTMRAIQNDRNQIRNHLNRHYPLERWQLQVVTVPDTWCDRELYLRYLGELTPEEDAADRAERRALWERQQAASREKRAREALEARLQAQTLQAQNRAKAAGKG